MRHERGERWGNRQLRTRERSSKRQCGDRRGEARRQTCSRRKRESVIDRESERERERARERAREREARRSKCSRMHAFMLRALVVTRGHGGGGTGVYILWRAERCGGDKVSR
jgi:hypothetical protein